MDTRRARLRVRLSARRGGRRDVRAPLRSARFRRRGLCPAGSGAPMMGEPAPRLEPEPASNRSGSTPPTGGGSRGPPPDYLTPDDMALLIRGASGRTADRDRALLWTLWGTACRASEACGMLLERVSFGERAITFYRRKVDDWHRGVLPEEGWRALEAYLSGRRLRGSVSSGPLFPGLRGPLTPNGVWRVVRTCGTAAGVATAKLHPHAIRHGRAQQLLGAGFDIFHVSHLLGHREVKTTQRYLRWNLETMRRMAKVGL